MLYKVNKNSQIKTGDHIVHTHDCIYGPKDSNAKELGYFESERVALSEAAKYYTSVNGCSYCCKSIHLKR